MFPCREHLPDEGPSSASQDPFTLLLLLLLLVVVVLVLVLVVVVVVYT